MSIRRSRTKIYKRKNPKHTLTRINKSNTKEQQLKRFEKKLEQQYGIELTLLPRFQHDAFVLNEIIVSPQNRKRGVGTEAMNDIVKYADDNKFTIVLTPDNTIGGGKKIPKSKLIKFYKNFGFVLNKGRHKDFRFSELMIRIPND